MCSCLLWAVGRELYHVRCLMCVVCCLLFVASCSLFVLWRVAFFVVGCLMVGFVCIVFVVWLGCVCCGCCM